MSPIYDTKKTWLQNLQEGPFFHSEIPARPPFAAKEFLGFQIASPIGVPAGPLLNANWVGLAADLGYDILTYKTIRSYEHPSHPLPNIAFIDTPEQLNPRHLPSLLHQLPSEPQTIDQLAITNSFGNPSMSSEYLKKDLPQALKKLHPGQLLIVSVFGTNAEEYLASAALAKECGAKVIEANFSCPNVSKKEGSLFSDPEAVYQLSKQLTKAIGATPLIIKLGTISDPSTMQQVLEGAARAGVRAVCGINTISMPITPPLNGNRTQCGICGAPIRQAALDFTRMAREIIDREKLDLELMATGGVTQPHHFQELLDAGASVAMTAAGMMWDPFLASKFHQGVYHHAK
jgi:dihydroorotate dehydrogenase (NAD+) catalytic subunit